MPLGRPKKAELTPFYDPALGRWRLDIPASIAGKRQKRVYKSQSLALDAARGIMQGVEVGAGYVAPSNNHAATISRLAAAFIAEKKVETSQANVVTLRWGLTRLCSRFGDMAPAELTPAMVNPWIASQKYETRGRFNLFCAGRAFFNSPLVRDLQPVNPFRDPPPKRKRGARLEILTPEELKTILALDLKPFFRAWIVCGAFAGLRSIEFKRLAYESFDFENMEIVVRRDQSKQGEAARPRSITICEAFKRHIPKGKGPLSEGSNWKTFSVESKKAAEAIGKPRLEKNTLRHSFASYHLGLHQNAALTAFQMGHVSANMIYATYANAVSKADSQKWFSV